MDGASTDGSVAILERLRGRRAAPLRVTAGRWSERGGQRRFPAARPVKSLAGSTQTISTRPDALRTVGAYFAERPEVEWLFGRCPIVDRDDRPYKGLVTRYKEFWLRRYQLPAAWWSNFISQPAVFFRRRLLERVGLLNPDYHLAMDYHLWLRMGRVAAPTFLDRELAYFRSSGDNKMSLQWRRASRRISTRRRRVAGDGDRCGSRCTASTGSSCRSPTGCSIACARIGDEARRDSRAPSDDRAGGSRRGYVRVVVVIAVDDAGHRLGQWRSPVAARWAALFADAARVGVHGASRPRAVLQRRRAHHAHVRRQRARRRSRRTRVVLGASTGDDRADRARAGGRAGWGAARRRRVADCRRYGIPREHRRG